MRFKSKQLYESENYLLLADMQGLPDVSEHLRRFPNTMCQNEYLNSVSDLAGALQGVIVFLRPAKKYSEQFCSFAAQFLPCKPGWVCIYI